MTHGACRISTLELGALLAALALGAPGGALAEAEARPAPVGGHRPAAHAVHAPSMHAVHAPAIHAVHATAAHAGQWTTHGMRPAAGRRAQSARRVAHGYGGHWHGYGHRYRGAVAVGGGYYDGGYSGEYGTYGAGYDGGGYYGYSRHHSCRWYRYNDPSDLPYRCRGYGPTYGYSYYDAPSYGYTYGSSYGWSGGHWHGHWHGGGSHYAFHGHVHGPTLFAHGRAPVHRGVRMASHAAPHVAHAAPHIMSHSSPHVVSHAAPHVGGHGGHGHGHLP